MIPKVRRDRARQLRQESTLFEQSFWLQVRGGHFSGFKFRRQQPLGPYIADFVCQQARLVVELDGSQHAEAGEYDHNRDAWLREEGYRVLRVWNSEWSTQREAVLEKLWQMLHEELLPSPPAPLPKWERGGKTPTPSSLQQGAEAQDFLSPLRGENRSQAGPSPLKREAQRQGVPSPLREENQSQAIPSPLKREAQRQEVPSPLRKENRSQADPSPLKREAHGQGVPSLSKMETHGQGVPSPLRGEGQGEGE